MIVGNGMLANAFRLSAADKQGACIFASGVSNSHCIDPKEFSRESDLLQDALAAHSNSAVFVYFGTCGAYDPTSRSQPYVSHKLALERMVLQHPLGLVIRLPQVVGPNASPHTLVSALCENIRLGRTINVWEHATRNIVDVVDVVKIVSTWISTSDKTNRIINVANPFSYPIKVIIESIETVLGRKAILNVVSAGAAYEIDIEIIKPLIKNLGLDFGKDYLPRVIARYYL